jgi:hypothetical protein
VLVIMGIAGVGKTVLAEQLSRHLQPTVGRAVALNFEARSKVGFVDIAVHCLEQAGQRVNPTERQDPQQLMHRWLALLVHEPQWVVMDSLEALLVGDEERGWSVFRDPLWADFFHQVLGLGILSEPDHFDFPRFARSNSDVGAAISPIVLGGATVGLIYSLCKPSFLPAMAFKPEDTLVLAIPHPHW